MENVKHHSSPEQFFLQRTLNFSEFLKLNKTLVSEKPTPLWQRGTIKLVIGKVADG